MMRIAGLFALRLVLRFFSLFSAWTIISKGQFLVRERVCSFFSQRIMKFTLNYYGTLRIVLRNIVIDTHLVWSVFGLFFENVTKKLNEAGSTISGMAF